MCPSTPRAPRPRRRRGRTTPGGGCRGSVVGRGEGCGWRTAGSASRAGEQGVRSVCFRHAARAQLPFLAGALGRAQRRFSAPARGRRSRRRAGQGVHTAGAELVARARGARRTRFCRGHTLRRVGARSALRGCLPAGTHARTHRAIANAVLPSFQLLHQAEGARHHDASHRGSATAEQFGCRSGLQGKKHR